MERADWSAGGGFAVLEVVKQAEDGLENEEADYYGAEDGVGCIVELFDVSDVIFWGVED